MKFSDWLKKMWVSKAAKMPLLNISEEDWQTFFRSPIWVLFRQQAIRMTNNGYKMMSSRDDNIRQAGKQQIDNVAWVLESEQEFKKRLTANSEALEESAKVEHMLRQLMRGVNQIDEEYDEKIKEALKGISV